jgi:hypothetical protein
MSAMSDYLENSLLNAVLRNVSYSSPATVYAALFNSATDDASGGVEVVGGSYARAAVTFGPPSDGVVANSGVVAFPTASAPWGTVTHFAIMDALTFGNRLFHGALQVSKTVDSGDVFTFQIGNLQITIQ